MWLWTFVASSFTVVVLRPTCNALVLTETIGADFDGAIQHATLRRNLQPIRKNMDSLLLREFGTTVRGMCKELYNHRERLWTFLADPAVEPTNNAGERSLRHGVIWRKLSFGTQSEHGDRFVETMLTIIETCQKQGKCVLGFITQAFRQTNTSIQNLSLPLDTL